MDVLVVEVAIFHMGLHEEFISIIIYELPGVHLFSDSFFSII